MHPEILFHWKLNLSAISHLDANPFNFEKRSTIQKKRSINPARLLILVEHGTDKRPALASILI